MALPRRAVLVALGAALGGCTGPATTTERPAGTDDTAPPTASHTTTATEPAYLDCNRPTISKDLPEEATAIPRPLTEESVVEYVERLEEFVVLPLENGEPDGYISIASVTVDTVEYGYLATVPVTGGYYNEEHEDSTATLHADLGTHTATYFVTEQVVRRAEDTNAELDPREHGEVVVCDSG